jgi:hypothetical protein
MIGCMNRHDAIAEACRAETDGNAHQNLAWQVYPLVHRSVGACRCKKSCGVFRWIQRVVAASKIMRRVSRVRSEGSPRTNIRLRWKLDRAMANHTHAQLQPHLNIAGTHAHTITHAQYANPPDHRRIARPCTTDINIRHRARDASFQKWNKTQRRAVTTQMPSKGARRIKIHIAHVRTSIRPRKATHIYRVGGRDGAR